MPALLELTKTELLKNEVLYGVSWAEYERLVQENWGFQSPKLTYNRGILEFEMPNSDEHELAGRMLARLAETILLQLEIDFLNFGSMTFKREDIRQGFEPDSCFYIQSLELIAGKSNIGIENDIPPDLTIEINKTSSSLPRMPIFAEFGVKEVWRFDDNQIKFYELVNETYLETENSFTLPILTSAKATESLNSSKELKSTAWAKKVRQFVAENKGV